MSAFDVFSTLSLFKQVTHEELVSLIPRIALDFATFRAGELMLDEGAEPAGLMYLMEGRVLGRYKDSRLSFEPGDLMSFTGLFGHRRRSSYSLEAIEDVRVLTLDAKSLIFLMQQHTAIMTLYLGWLADVADPVRCLHLLNERQSLTDGRS